MKDPYKDVINEIKLIIKKYEGKLQDLDLHTLYTLPNDTNEQLAIFSARKAFLTTQKDLYEEIIFDLSNTDAILHDDD